MVSPEDRRLEVLELAAKARRVLLEHLPEMIEEIDFIMAEAVSRLEAGLLDPLGAYNSVAQVGGLMRFTRRLQGRIKAGNRLDKKSQGR